MNWYKIIKLSAAEIQDDDLFPAEYIWIIDKGFKFYDAKTDNKVLKGHNDWDIWNKLDRKVLASGRYYTKTNSISNFLRYYYGNILHRPIEETKQIVHNILRQKYDNPKIDDFGWPI